MISNGVSVFCYTFAGESSEVVKFILNTINVILSSKKRNRNKKVSELANDALKKWVATFLLGSPTLA
jgi:hypothetical protein